MTTTPRKRPITPPATLARRTTQAGPITPPNRKAAAPITPPRPTKKAQPPAPAAPSRPPATTADKPATPTDALVNAMAKAEKVEPPTTTPVPISPPAALARRTTQAGPITPPNRKAAAPITPPRATKKAQPPAPATPSRPPATTPVPISPPARPPFDDSEPTAPITPPPPLHQQEREGVTAATQDSAVDNAPVVNEVVKNAPDKDKPVINEVVVSAPLVNDDAGAMPPLEKHVNAKRTDSGGSEKAAPMATKENAPRAPIVPPKRAAKKRAITPPARPRNDGPPPMRGEPIRPPAAMKEQMARARQRDSEAMKSEEGNEFGQTLPADYEYETQAEAMFYNVFGGTDDIMGGPDPLVFMLANRAMPSPRG